jgi:hypothetical protein
VAAARRGLEATAVRLLRVCFPYPSNVVAIWSECQRPLPHMLAVANHSQRLDVRAMDPLSSILRRMTVR